MLTGGIVVVSCSSQCATFMVFVAASQKMGISSSFVAGCNAFARGSLFSLLSDSPCTAPLSSLADRETFLVKQSKMLM